MTKIYFKAPTIKITSPQPIVIEDAEFDPESFMGPAGTSPTVVFGAGDDIDRLVINGTVTGPHLTGPVGPGGGEAIWGYVTGMMSAQTDLSSALNGKAASTHAHSPGDVTGTAVITNDSRLSDARTPTAHTHTMSDTTDLVTTLAGKEPANSNIQTHVVSAHAPSNAQKNSDITKAEIEAKLTGEISTHTHAGGGAGLGVAINVQALTSSPADAATVYFGMLPKAPTTTANISKIYTPAGTIKRVVIYCYSGTAGTAEAWSLYVRKNNSADTLIATISVAASERKFENASLSISMNGTTDYIEIKGIQPTWVTNPLTTIYGGYIYME